MSVCPSITKRRNRRGSALLLCTLAIAVISLASIAILRSNLRGIARVDALRNSRQSRQLADGWVQRSAAMLRLNPSFAGSLPLPGSAPAGTRVELTPLSPTATRIQIFLYDQATVPARDLVVNPIVLAGPITPPVTPVTPTTPTTPGKPPTPPGKPPTTPGKPPTTPGKPPTTPGKPPTTPGKPPTTPGKGLGLTKFVTMTE